MTSEMGRRNGRRAREADQRLAAEISERLRQAGARDPQAWALSEVNEDLAQYARFLFLRGIWRRMHSCADEALASEFAAKLRREGAGEDDQHGLVPVALGRLAFDMLYLLDEPDGTAWDPPSDLDVAGDGPRWRLYEVESDGRLTGRDLGGLHESWGDTDPDGNAGAGWGG